MCDQCKLAMKRRKGKKKMNVRIAKKYLVRCKKMLEKGDAEIDV